MLAPTWIRPSSISIGLVLVELVVLDVTHFVVDNDEALKIEFCTHFDSKN